MYVDRRLAGIQAVQTLSRLNRAHAGKDTNSAGHYDDFEVNRVVEVELGPRAKQSDLVRALEPVRDRLTKRFQTAAKLAQPALGNAEASQSAKDEMNALILFKGDMGAYLRLYTFPLADLRLRTLSLVSLAGNADIEKRAIIFTAR